MNTATPQPKRPNDTSGGAKGYRMRFGYPESNDTSVERYFYEVAKEQAAYDAETAAYLAYHGIFGAPQNRQERRKAASLLRRRRPS